MALAKGGLVPDHVLICPIGHFESTVKLSEVRSSFLELSFSFFPAFLVFFCLFVLFTFCIRIVNVLHSWCISGCSDGNWKISFLLVSLSCFFFLFNCNFFFSELFVVVIRWGIFRLPPFFCHHCHHHHDHHHDHHHYFILIIYLFFSFFRTLYFRMRHLRIIFL